MRPVAFGEALTAGARLTLFSDDKPDGFLPSLSSGWMQPRALHLSSKTGVPSYQVEDEEGRTHLLIRLAIEEQNEHRWCLWRPGHAGFSSRSIFEGALIEE
jgi:hypothetical protein